MADTDAELRELGPCPDEPCEGTLISGRKRSALGWDAVIVACNECERIDATVNAGGFSVRLSLRWHPDATAMASGRLTSAFAAIVDEAAAALVKATTPLEATGDSGRSAVQVLDIDTGSLLAQGDTQGAGLSAPRFTLQAGEKGHLRALIAVLGTLPASQAAGAARSLREFELWEEGFTRSNAHGGVG